MVNRPDFQSLCKLDFNKVLVGRVTWKLAVYKLRF